MDEIAARARWQVPSDQYGVRAFFGIIGITRRWAKNFAEPAGPLSRLTGKVDWQWTQAEQLSFEEIKIKCTTRTSTKQGDQPLSPSLCTCKSARDESTLRHHLLGRVRSTISTKLSFQDARKSKSRNPRCCGLERGGLRCKNIEHSLHFVLGKTFRSSGCAKPRLNGEQYK